MRKKELGQSCKHLGLASDVGRHLDAASKDHRCYLSGVQGLVDLSHQEDYCLTERWRSCPWPGAQPALEPWKMLVQRSSIRAGLAASIALVFLSIILFRVSADRVEVATSLTNAATAPEETAKLSANAGASANRSQQPLADGNELPLDPGRYVSKTAEASTPTPVQTEGTLASPSPPLQQSSSPVAGRDSAPLSITALADGSSEAILTYPERGQQTIRVKVPSDWELASAQLDLAGEAYSVGQVDQKNEASQHESTWGVRAQQFRPAGNVLTSVEIFLTHASSKAGDLTVEIREDDGKGYPSTNVLTSVSKPVPAGGYRWEVFDFPDVEVRPGHPYWIVNYVKPLGEIAYPATPSVGDYGYYVGMSLKDEYAGGDSADFLTFSSGSRWEKYASRNAWDLMFRIHSLVQFFPKNPRLNVGSDAGIDWSYPGELKGTAATGDLSSAMGDFLRSQRRVPGADGLIPLLVESDSPGVIRVSNIRITKKASP